MNEAHHISALFTLMTNMSITRGSVTCLFLSNISLTLSLPWRVVMSSWNIPTVQIHEIQTKYHCFHHINFTQELIFKIFIILKVLADDIIYASY